MGNTLGRDDGVDAASEVDLRHFTLLRCIGKGAFGKVRIVELRDTKRLYALKYINKMQCIKMRAIQNIFRERAILEELHHPLIVNLRFAFQDDENMFMVLDLMMGGDLRFHLDRIGGFSEPAARFIAAEVVCAISYLHANKIVHRDIKPDNVLLDSEGHAHLTDFNIAVKFDNRKYLKSHSGTMAYMAPEIFGDKGYLWQVDWWSFGIVLFELLYGKRPFRGQNNETLQAAIKTTPLHFHRHNQLNKQPMSLTPECTSFIAGLLERDASKRLGCGPTGVFEIFEHPWFKGFDWGALERKELRPVFVPDSDRPNFDATFDLEELLLDDQPLTHKPRRKKPSPNSPNALSSGGGASNSPRPSLAARNDDVPGIPILPGVKARSRSVVEILGLDAFQPPAAAVAAAGVPAGDAAGNPLQPPAMPSTGQSAGAGIFPFDVHAPGSIIHFASAGGSGTLLSAKDRTAAELQFIEDNFRRFDWVVARRLRMQQEAAARIQEQLQQQEGVQGKAQALEGQIQQPQILQQQQQQQQIRIGPRGSGSLANQLAAAEGLVAVYHWHQHQQLQHQQLQQPSTFLQASTPVPHLGTPQDAASLQITQGSPQATRILRQPATPLQPAAATATNTPTTGAVGLDVFGLPGASSTAASGLLLPRSNNMNVANHYVHTTANPGGAAAVQQEHQPFPLHMHAPAPTPAVAASSAALLFDHPVSGPAPQPAARQHYQSSPTFNAPRAVFPAAAAPAAAFRAVTPAATPPPQLQQPQQILPVSAEPQRRGPLLLPDGGIRLQQQQQQQPGQPQQPPTKEQVQLLLLARQQLRQAQIQALGL
ncbi:hypothetical protein HK405_008299, partial [Cladochytrium tenue]